MWKSIAFLLLLLLTIACQESQPPIGSSNVIVIVGATVIDGVSEEAIQNAVLAIEGDTIQTFGPQGSVQIPNGARRIDATGKTIMPAIFNMHGHVALSTAMERGLEHHTRENIQRDANAYLYYGVAHVASLGINGEAMQSFVADQQTGRAGGARVHSAGLGFAAKNGFLPGGSVQAVHRPGNPEEARAMVREEAAKGVALIKIWVDDAEGKVPKISPELYAAIIDEAHLHNLKVLAHMYYLDDAKELMRRGIDALAHPVRDQEVDEEFLNLAKEKGITQVSVLIGTQTAQMYVEDRSFLDDPALPLLFPASVLDVVRSEEYRRQRAASDLERSRQQNAIAVRNIRKEAAAGIPVAVGTDSQGAGRLQGLWEQIEMKLLVDAGLPPMEAIRAATLNPAKFLGIAARFGTIAPGKVADFIILNSNPLADISNTRDISEVWLNGKPVDRAALALRQ